MTHGAATLALVWVLLGTLTVHGQSPQEPAKLQGVWQPVKGVSAGNALPEQLLKQTRLTIDGDKWVVVANGVTDKGVLKLLPNTKPMAMDLIGVAGPNEGKKLLTIYQLQANRLTIAYELNSTNDPDAKRPTEFKSSANNGVLLLEYQRAPWIAERMG